MKTNKIKLLLLFIAITQWKFINAQNYPYVVPNTDWIKYYSQSDALVSSAGSIDANSNVYSTGYSGLMTNSNLIAIKYDSTGLLKYAFTYNNGSFDVGKAIKIDGNGNAYVAGISTGTTGSTNRDYIIVKISPLGSALWIKRYDRGVTNIDEANALAVDASGNVYVTGKSKNSSGNYDIVTLKLNGSTGNIVWTNIYSGSGLDDIGTGIVLSANSQYVYITGNTTNSSTGSNIVTYALNASTGGSYWSSAIITDGTASGSDKSNGIIQVGQNIVICGEVTNSTTGLDYIVIKYDGSNGGIIWQTTYDNANASNRATALAKDSAGNIGVIGTLLNGSTYEYHTVLYSPSGTQYGVNIESTDLGTTTIDPSICNDTIAHHWYGAGEKLKNTKDIFVYQITPTANTAWRKTIDGQNNDIDHASAVVVNGVGVVYAVGQSKNSGANYDYTTIKLNQTPVYWPPDFSGETVNLNHLYLLNEGQVMRNDSTFASEVIYYTHHTNPSVYVEHDGFNFVTLHEDTVQSTLDTCERIQYKFLNNNTLADLHSYFPRSTTYNYYLSYAQSDVVEGLRGNERIFIPNYYPYIDLHYFSGATGIKYYLVVKPGALLDEVTMEINGANSTSIDGSTGKLTIDGVLNDITLNRPIAYTTNTLGQVVTISGNASWSHVTGDQYKILPPSSYNASLPLVIQVSPSSTSANPAAKINGTNLEYSTYGGGTANDVFNDVNVKPNGDRAIVGYETGGVFPTQNGVFSWSGNWDMVMLNYTADDTLRVATYMGGEAQDKATSVAHDSQGNVYIGGITTSTTMFGWNVPGATNQFNNGGASGAFKQDGFLAKFLAVNNNTTTLNWRRYFGGSLSDAINSIYIDATNNLYIAGSSNSTDCPVINAFKATLGATTTANPANIDAIFGKFDANMTAQWITYYGGSANASGGGTFTQDEGTDIVVDNNGRVIGCGFTDATNLSTVNNTGQTNTFFKSTISGQSDGFLVRYSSNGTPDFSSYFGGSNSDGINRLVYKPLFNEIFFAGTSYKGTGFPFVIKSGAYNSQYSSGGYTAYLGWLDGNLNQKWCTYWGKGQQIGKNYEVNGLSVDDEGLVYLSGWTNSDSLTYPSSFPTSIVYKDSVRNGDDGFVAIFNQNKNLYHAHYFGGSGGDRINNSDIGQGQKLYLVGYSGSSNFPVAYNSVSATLIDSTFNGGQDGFISRFELENYQVVGLEKVSVDNIVGFIYPNPSNYTFHIELKGVMKSTTNVKVTNLLGQLIYQGEITEQNTTINCHSWANGVYLINISNNEAKNTFKIIKE